MTLLEEIQKEAIDSNTDLGSLLRKCKLLAARLDNSVLESWLTWESNGYSNSSDVPLYRIIPLEIKGDFAGYHGAALKNMPIPIFVIPEEFRENFLSFKCTQSISSIEQIAKSSSNSTLRVSTQNLSFALGQNVYPNYNCIDSWAECSSGLMIEILNSVRNRILDFTLAIWKKYPEAGEIVSTSNKKPSSEQVSQIFNTTVYGGSANLIGTANDSTFNFTVNQGDFESLEKALQSHEVSEDDIKVLQIALREELKIEDGKFGPKVSAWVGSMVQKAAIGSWGIATGAAANIISDLLIKYYGG